MRLAALELSDVTTPGFNAGASWTSQAPAAAAGDLTWPERFLRISMYESIFVWISI